MRDVVERPAKWDVDDSFVLPTLDDIVADGEVHHDTIDVTNVYYDTADHDLQAQGVVLRRRDGEGKTGWQLEIPDNGGRALLHWTLSDHPPADVTTLLAGMTLGKNVVDVAKIHTTRDRYRIREQKNRQICLEVDDDRVRASVGERLLAWRQLDVGPGTGAKSVTTRLSKRLRAAGAQPARHPSELARVSPAEPTGGSPPPAATALADYLNAQIDRMVAGDIGLRRGQDPIHDTRVAIRRLRSTLRVFGKVLDSSAIAGMDAELKWYAGLLGEVRDCQVQQRRFTKALDGIPDELILGPVKARIRNDLHAVQLPARARLNEAMDSARYMAIMAVLRRWRAGAPLDQDLATKALGKALGKRARRAQRKADRRLVAALDSGEDDMLHRARKAAKRARYAAELRKPVDKGAKRTVKHNKRIQTVLGDHQDTVVASHALRQMALSAGTTVGENGFTFGMLYSREQQLARQCRQQAGNLSQEAGNLM